MSQLTPEICKTTCINTVEQYLQVNKIKYNKMESKSGSIYYELQLYNGNPKIRVSDHKFHKDEDYKLCSLSINYCEDFGKNSNPKKVRARVQSMIEKLIKNHNLYHIHRVFEKLDTSNKGDN